MLGAVVDVFDSPFGAGNLGVHVVCRVMVGLSGFLALLWDTLEHPNPWQMLQWLISLLTLPILVSSLEKTHGVSPKLLSLYTPLEGGKWSCFDGSKEIPWSSVNNDYCDCPDGSDEPGNCSY